MDCDTDHIQAAAAGEKICSACGAYLQNEPDSKGRIFKIGEKIFFLGQKTSVTHPGIVVAIPSANKVKVRYTERTWATPVFDEIFDDLSRVATDALQLQEGMGSRSRRQTTSYQPPVKAAEEKKRKQIAEAKAEAAPKKQKIIETQKTVGNQSAKTSEDILVEAEIENPLTINNDNTVIPPAEDHVSEESEVIHAILPPQRLKPTTLRKTVARPISMLYHCHDSSSTESEEEEDT